MTSSINIVRIFSITLMLMMNSCISSGSFLENFLYHTSIHISKESKNSYGIGLDPLNFEKKITINDSDVRLNLSFNGIMKGYTNYTLERIDITPDLNVSFIGTLMDTQVSGNYKMDGAYFTVLPILGDGMYLFKLKNVHLALDTQILPKDARLQVLGFDLDYMFDDLEISIWGLTGDQAVGNVLKDFIKDLITVALQKKKTTIIQHVNSFVLKEGNAKLKNMTLQNLIELMKDIFVY